jgi:hypothetical protein
MSLFDWLVLGHLVGDFLLQTDNMAKNKSQQWRWLLRHIALYMVTMTIIIVAYALSHPTPLWLAIVAWLFIAGTHLILDRRGFTARWMRLVGTSPDQSWLVIVVDQIFHLLTLAAVAQVLALASR